jgi:hypothetical protein
MFQPIESCAKDIRWDLVPEMRERLLGPDGLRLPEWLASGQARVVKHGPHRTVYRVNLPDLRFYLKHNRVHDVRAWLRGWLRPSKARIEYEHARAVAARRVPSVVPLGMGERRQAPGRGDSFLITRTLDDTEPLRSFIDQTFPRLERKIQARVRLRLAKELGRLVARLHDTGVLHDDLHLGNVVVRLEAGDQPRLFLIDLHALRLGRPLSWPASRDNLVILNRFCVIRMTRTDRLRFCRAYCLARYGRRSTLPPLSSRAVIADLERRTWLSNFRFWPTRDVRCLSTNRYFSRLRSRGVTAYAVRDLDRTQLDALMADPDAPFRRTGVAAAAVELEMRVNGVSQQVVYQRFPAPSWKGAFKTFFRWSAPMQMWWHGHAVRDRWLPTPRPLALLRRHRWALPRESYLLRARVDGAVPLERFLVSLRSLSPEDRREVLHRRIEQLALLVRLLHQRGLSQPRLSTAGIAVSDTPAPEERLSDPPPWLESLDGIWLMDLVGITCRFPLPRSERVRNLARLFASLADEPTVSRTDRLRFLGIYLEWGVGGRAGWKTWWREIDTAARKLVARSTVCAEG